MLRVYIHIGLYDIVAPLRHNYNGFAKSPAHASFVVMAGNGINYLTVTNGKARFVYEI